MKQILLLMVLALGMCNINVCAQTKKPANKTTSTKTATKQVPKDSREYQVGDDGFEWYKVCKNGKYGAEDREGKVLIPNEYDDVGLFSTALTGAPNGFMVFKGDYKGWYDTGGRCIIPYTRGYTSVLNSRDNDLGIYYKCEKNNRLILCDINGKEVCSIPVDFTKYSAAIPMFDSKYNVFYFILHSGRDNLYAIADGNGNIVSGPSKREDVSISLVSTKTNPLANNPKEESEVTPKKEERLIPQKQEEKIPRDPIPVQQWQACLACGGMGTMGCDNCGGSGTKYIGDRLHRCSLCNGQGIIPCRSCYGNKGQYITVYR